MIKVGSILSETQFYVVKEIKGDEIIVKDDFDNEIAISQEYVDKILNSADKFTKEEKVSATQLADIFISHPRIAMTVCYRKKDETKSAKALKKEKDDAKQKLLSANVNDLPKFIDDLINNPIQSIIPGEERVIRGRHYSHLTDLGRMDFTDMEVPKTTGTYDSRNRQVDPRTLKYVIVGGVKYILK